MNLIIDRDTGEVSAKDPSFRFGPDTRLRPFLHSIVGRGSKKIRANRYFYETRLPLNERTAMAAVFLFNKDTFLQQINIRLLGDEPTEYSRKDEDRVKQAHDAWLVEALGEPPYEFDWGTVISVIDPHGYLALISIIYRRITTEEYAQKEAQALSRLSRVRVRTVEIREPSVAFSMSNGVSLVCRVSAEVVLPDRALSEDDPRYKASLASRVGETIDHASFEERSGVLSLLFLDGVEVRFKLRSFQGKEERALLRTLDDDLYVF